MPFDPQKYDGVDRDLVYSTTDGHKMTMDVHFPSSGGPWPGLIFVHGGGWSEGDKAPLPLVPTAAGYLVASINYRMFPAYRFPAMIEDVKCAVRYLRAHAATLHVDPERIGMIGHSAGAHLAALAGLADESAGWDVGPYLAQSSRVQAVIALSGPSDLTRAFSPEIRQLIDSVFGPQQLVSASPLHYAHPKAPPFLIIHGDADAVVPVEQAHLLYKALAAAGSPVETLILHNAGHGFEPVGGAMSPSVQEMFAKMLLFANTHLRNQS